MMKRKLLFAIIIILLGCTSSWGVVHGASTKKTGFKKTDIPTFFIHGYGSSYRAERYMVNSATENGVTNTVLPQMYDATAQSVYYIVLAGQIKVTTH